MSKYSVDKNNIMLRGFVHNKPPISIAEYYGLRNTIFRGS
jgi:hypothetical protein